MAADDATRRVTGFWRQILWPSEPGASVFIAFAFGLPAVLRWRIGGGFAPGELVWALYVVAVLLVTAAMILGVIEGARWLALRVATAAFLGLFGFWAIWIGWRLLAGPAAPGLSLSSLLHAAMMACWGAQIVGWWATERRAAESRGRPDVA
ncbi:hypothetical protein AAFN86_17190 [Roseomonas sp. CAU 1739]|uniref:hypothetical protein n=1 Tax=Roseomonas sp. CAU 1739 TaxID=3140364 RepID=UPI00325BFD5C